MIIAICILLVAFYTTIPVWQKPSTLHGTYIMEAQPNSDKTQLQLNFDSNGNLFWVNTNTPFSNYYTVSIYGTFEKDSNLANHFYFSGDNKDSFESFTVINRHYDIAVTINGTEYLFRRISARLIYQGVLPDAIVSP